MNEVTATIILYLAVIMPGNIPDMQKELPMPTLEECFANAKEWDERGVTQKMADKGAIAVLAGCRVTDRPT
jgi:hypothetical protein